nr:NAD(+)/NADH kinase [Desulfolucanica intricata]
MKTFGLAVNLSKKSVVTLVEKIINWLESQNCSILIKPDAAKVIGRPELGCTSTDIAKSSECLIAFGGDGTLLQTTRLAAPYGVPVLGVNLGHLGFLTEIDIPDIITSLERLLAGQYNIEERMMLEAGVLREGEVMTRIVGLNDAVITKGAFARLILLDTYVNSDFVGTYPADGLIIASPTGSTAYSLSAGGPLVTPDLEVMILTPICPHTLTSRPMVISAQNTVRVVIPRNQGEVMLTMDGQHGYQLLKNDEVLINKAPYNAKFLKIKGVSFFDVLREKLEEGERSDG